MTGYNSKRQMAQDKVAQPAQDPVFTYAQVKAHIQAAMMPIRPWLGLTYEDMVKLQKDLYDAKGESVLPTTFAMAVESKLKEKNFGSR